MATGRRRESRQDRLILASLDFELPCAAPPAMHAQSSRPSDAGAATVFVQLRSRSCGHLTPLFACGSCTCAYQRASRMTCRCGVSAPRSEWVIWTRAFPKPVKR